MARTGSFGRPTKTIQASIFLIITLLPRSGPFILNERPKKNQVRAPMLDTAWDPDPNLCSYPQDLMTTIVRSVERL